MSIRILLADDHRMLRDGLRSILDQDSDAEVVAEADDGRIAVQLCAELKPDIVVMDIGMPALNGIEATRQISSEHPEVKVIALSMHCDRRYALQMLDAGASGYVLKQAACGELLRAIRIVSEGQYYLSPQITGIVIESYVGRLPVKGASKVAALSSREREVLQLLAEGKTSRQIATALHMSGKTADTHRRNIMRRLDLHTIADLTKFAVREGLTALEG